MEKLTQEQLELIKNAEKRSEYNYLECFIQQNVIRIYSNKIVTTHNMKNGLKKEYKLTGDDYIYLNLKSLFRKQNKKNKVHNIVNEFTDFLYQTHPNLYSTVSPDTIKDVVDDIVDVLLED